LIRPIRQHFQSVTLQRCQTHCVPRAGGHKYVCVS
jgi:hypothetical protein